ATAASDFVQADAESVFIFEDRSGRRWLRLKGAALAFGALIGAVAVMLLLAALLVAPGRAQSPPPAPSKPDQVQQWPNRGGAPQSALPQQATSPSQEGTPEPSSANAGP